MQVLIAGHREVGRLLPMDECITVMEQVLRTLAQGRALQPLRSVIILPEQGAVGLMPSYLGEPPAVGAKVITVFNSNLGTPYESHQGAVLLFEPEHGRLLAIVDAGAITAIRTAAVSGAATRALAREDAADLAILGSGTQARTHLAAMLAVRPITRVRIWSRTPEHARRFVDSARAAHNVDITAVPSPREAVDGATIICTTTAATGPIVEGEWLAPGTHINGAGASVPGFRELDTLTVQRSRLFVDRRESALNEADDIRIPLRDGVIEEDHIRGELGDILVGRVPGRTRPDEITLFESMGLAIEDLAAAYHVYRKRAEQTHGTWVEFAAERPT